MKISKIVSIKKYKSFIDFKWSNFCKDNNGQESALSPFSVVFGENGSGKSTICNILKSLSQDKDFFFDEPECAEIKIKNDSSQPIDYKYENGQWDKDRLDKNSILFFDIDFVNENVHTHGNRESSMQKGGHTQHAGQLIIDLDAKANLLKKKVKQYIKYKNYFIGCNEHCLSNLNITEYDNVLFKQLCDIKPRNNKKLILKTQKKIDTQKKKIRNVELLIKKQAQISQINEIDKLSFSYSISLKSVYEEIFSRKLKQKVDDKVDESIKKHFDVNKKFLEWAKDYIPEKYTEENCPLCMQPLSGAEDVIKFYKNTFDQTYEKEKQKLIDDINSLKNEINEIKIGVASLEGLVVSIFDVLEKLKKDFEIKDIYNLEEKERVVSGLDQYLKIPDEFNEIIVGLDGLKSIEKKEVNIKSLYDNALSYITKINLAIKRVNEIIEIKNNVIISFKDKYSDSSKISKEIEDINKKIEEKECLIDFLRNNKNDYIHRRDFVLKKKDVLTERVKNFENKLNKHLAEKIPQDVTSTMIGILDKFNLNFSIEHIQSTANTKDYAFSFEIKDKNGHERELKNNLSEGERQLISSAFFFAVNKNLDDRDKKVLVFDDPITSLDSPNLKILADLIFEHTKEFAQVIVFTHHPLFYKYLIKCGNPNKFGILKNDELCGGSFVFFDSNFDLIEEIQNCNEEIKQNAQNGTLRMEEISLKYGQLLRLAIEKFIKYDLLMWDKEKNFEEGIVNNLRSSKNKMLKLTNDDYDVISNIYKYCNYSNLLHVDKENPSALSELVFCIDTFVNILNKARS